MKKMISVFVLLAIFVPSVSVQAQTCLAIRMLEDKLSSDIKVKNDLKDSIYLSNKLSEVSNWEEFLILKKLASEGVQDITSSVFTAKEIDILLLIDALYETKEELNKELAMNALKISGSLGVTYATTKVVNKMLAGGFKSGFMLKVQSKLLSSNNSKKINKLLHLSNVLALATPTYLAYKEYNVYKMLKGVRQKIDVLEDLSASLPELEVLEERIEHDTIRINELKAASNCR